GEISIKDSQGVTDTAEFKNNLVSEMFYDPDRQKVYVFSTYSDFLHPWRSTGKRRLLEVRWKCIRKTCPYQLAGPVPERQLRRLRKAACSCMTETTGLSVRLCRNMREMWRISV